jgi:hypothetical protein
MANVKIMAETLVPAVSLKRAGKLDMLISYLNLDGNMPGLVRIEADSADDAAVIAAIKADLVKPKARVGKTLSV